MAAAACQAPEPCAFTLHAVAITPSRSLMSSRENASAPCKATRGHRGLSISTRTRRRCWLAAPLTMSFGCGMPTLESVSTYGTSVSSCCPLLTPLPPSIRLTLGPGF